ncbi:MAG: hypothetical protein KIS92_17795 [Planctomycetota bacterium]|nr:hypothetical protein [Planctomycetota bacterium]
MKRALAMVAGLFLAFVAPAMADTIFLKNGDEINGKVVEESDNAVVIKVEGSGALRSINRANIDIIVYDKRPTSETLVAKAPEPAPVPKGPDTAKPSVPKKEEGKKEEGKKEEGKTGEKPPEGKEGEKKEGDPAEKKEGEEGGEKKEAKKNRPDYTEEEKKLIEDVAERLDTDDPNAREAAKGDLAKMGNKAIAAAVDGLMHKRVEARAAYASMLGDLRARTATKQLIEALYSVMPEDKDGEAPTYQVLFVRALKVSLANVTGESFINVEPDKPMVQEGLRKYIEWYNANFDRLPPQIDEELIEPNDPEYMDKIKKMRELNLVKKAYPRPALSVEKALGRENPPPTRPQDLEYEKAFPKTDRDSAGGYIRESDKKFGTDFFKQKDK